MLTGWFPGQGFGLGFSVVEELAPGATLGSVGQYGWGGAAGTYFWVDPDEELDRDPDDPALSAGRNPDHSRVQERRLSGDRRLSASPLRRPTAPAT